MCTEWPQNGIEYYEVKSTPCMLYDYSRVPNSNPFRSTDIRFRVTGHFKTIPQNEPEIILSTTTWKVHQIYSTTGGTLKSEVSTKSWQKSMH